MAGMLCRVRIGVPLLVALAILCVPAAAAADQRYASPAGSGTECTSASPCDFKTATEGAASGDEVIVAPGDYLNTPPIQIFNDLNVHGVLGQARPRIFFANNLSGAFVLNGATTLRHLELVATGQGSTLWLLGSNNAVVDRVISRSAQNAGCYITDAVGVVLSNTVCETTAAGAWGLFAEGSSASTSLTLSHVTVTASGASADGITAAATGSNTVTIDAINTVAQGTDDDVDTFTTDAGGQATVTLQSSNYATEDAFGPGTMSVTDPGTGTNQTASPVFAADGYHQLVSSPTVDAGEPSMFGGNADIDGDQRIVGTGPDVGADEYVPPVVPDPPPKPRCQGKEATIVGKAGSPIQGTGRADVIVGTSGADTIRAGKGNDTICARGGRDLVRAGAGRDSVAGEGGNDSLFGQAGADTLRGGRGADRLLGGPGRDRLFGGPGRDRLFGGPGRDLLRGGPGRDLQRQ